MRPVKILTAQADLSRRWASKQYCKKCCSPAHMSFHKDISGISYNFNLILTVFQHQNLIYSTSKKKRTTQYTVPLNLLLQNVMTMYG